MSPFASFSLLVAAGIAGPAGCFLVDPRLLLASGLLPLAGTARWGARWLFRVLAASAAPGLSALLFAVAGRPAPAVASLRWALSICCGAYFFTDAGLGPLAWWFTEAGSRLGRPGRALLRIGEALSLAGILASGLRSRSLRRPPGPDAEGFVARLLRLADETVSTLPADTPAEAEPRAPAADSLLVASAAWLYCMAGLASL